MILEDIVKATILGIVYHPEIRPLSDGCKDDIAKMVRSLIEMMAEEARKEGLCPHLKCNLSNKCTEQCDWSKGME